MWIRYNNTSKTYEYSENNGVSWSSLVIDAAQISQGTIDVSRIPTLPWSKVDKTGSSLSDLATRAIANLSDGSDVAKLSAANVFTNTGINSFAGKVGIGTTAPVVDLQVKNPTSSSGVIVGHTTLTTDAGLNGIRLQAHSSGENYIDLKTVAGGSTYFRTGQGVEYGSARTWLTVNATYGSVQFLGPIGIGGIASYKLHVIDGTDPSICLERTGTYASKWRLTAGYSAAGDLALYDVNAATHRLIFDSNGYANFTNTYGFGIGSPAGRRRIQTSDANTFGFLGDTDGYANIKLNTLYERNRSFPLGEWTSVTFSASNFTASGSMTWTVESADQVTLAYTVIGKTMVVAFSIGSTTVGGTVSTTLRIAIPGGFSSARAMQNACVTIDNGTRAIGYATVSASGTTIDITKVGAGNWTASTNNTSVYGMIVFEVQ